MSPEREAECLRKVTELARLIEADDNLSPDHGFDVIRYAIEDRASVASAVKKHIDNCATCRVRRAVKKAWR